MQFRDVIGQNEIKSRLLKSVRDGRIGHAQLFYGAPGVGKLPLALAFAQYISCTDRKEDDSCGVCPSCKKYSKLIHPDLHFVFPVIKVDKVTLCESFIKDWREFVLENPYFSYDMWLNRMNAENKQAIIYSEESAEIIKKVNFKPYESDYKIVIIWLPEKMHATGANKLLKFLEEPSPFTIFLLVSENPDQLLKTIYSRTQPVKIPGISRKDIAKALSEKGDLPDTAENIAKLADGSIISAMEIIEESEQNTHNLELFINLMRLAYGKKIVELVKWVDEVAKSGREKQKSFLQYSLRMVRENFVMNRNEPEIMYLRKKELDFSSRFHPYINDSNADGLYKEFSDAHYNIERNGSAKIIFFDLCVKLILLFRK